MKTRIILYIFFLLLAFSKSSFSNDQKLENKINKNLRYVNLSRTIHL